MWAQYIKLFRGSFAILNWILKIRQGIAILFATTLMFPLPRDGLDVIRFETWKCSSPCFSLRRRRIHYLTRTVTLITVYKNGRKAIRMVLFLNGGQFDDNGRSRGDAVNATVRRIPLTLQLPQIPLIVLHFATARMWSHWRRDVLALYDDILRFNEIVFCLHPGRAYYTHNK